MTTWWTRLRGWARRAMEKTFVENPAQWLVEMFGGRASATGVTVTPATAVQSVPVFASIRNIAEDVAKLPLKVFRRLPNGGKEPDPGHPLYALLHDQPNPEQTSIEFREWLVAHALLRANSYAEIVRTQGVVTALWPLHPDLVQPDRDASGELFYWVRVPDRLGRRTGTAQVALPRDRVLHLRSLSFDGVQGCSPIAVAREAIGLTLAVEEYGARFFGQGAQPGGVIKSPTVFSGPQGEQALKRVKESWEAAHGGLSMAHRVAILEGGMEWQQTGLQNEHAQFTETRLFQLREVVRLFRNLPHKVGDLERATFSNIEHQAIEYVVDTLLSWLVRVEQKLQVMLLTPTEQQTHFVKHVVAGLLRGDIQSRFQAYRIGHEIGVFCPNDIRELEDMNPIPDDKGGNDYVRAANMVVAGTPPAPAAPAPVPAPATERMLSLLMRDAATRALRKEIEAIRRAAGQHASDGAAWRAWVEEFYPRHAAYLAELLHVSLDAARVYTDDHRALLLAHGASVAETWDGPAVAALVNVATGPLTGNGVGA